MRHRERAYKKIIQEYKKDIVIAIFGPYKKIRRLRSLRDYLKSKGYSKTFLADDLSPKEVLGEDVETLSPEEVNRLMSEYLISKSDFRIFVIMHPPKINIGVYAELELYINRGYPLDSCIVLVEEKLYDQDTGRLNLGSSLLPGMMKLRNVPMETYSNLNQLKAAAYGKLTNFLYRRLSDVLHSENFTRS